MKRMLLISLLSLFYMLTNAQGGTWTWVKGADTLGDPGIIGTLGVTNSTNYPEGRYQAANWIDLNGNFWIFGGEDNAHQFRNDLWKYEPSTNVWTWMKGPLTQNGNGVYGTQGVPAPNNIPSARGLGMVSWTDKQGRLWLRGGAGYDQFGFLGDSDELWMYDIPTNQWTWMKGSSMISSSTNYGTLQVPNVNNSLGGRHECNTAWVKSDGTLWTFGGQDASNRSKNDMWKFDIATNNWTWMSGGASTNSYGALGVESATNLPPARGSYTRWQDANDNFYIFGGVLSDFSSTTLYNDVWKYNTTNNRWTWIAGSSLFNDPGQYTQLCVPSANASPSARYENRTAQILGCSNIFWTFGGINRYDVCLNDLWNFNTQTNQWTWVSGSNTANAFGNYGTINVPNSTNVPGARTGVCMWAQPNGNLWMWGGANFSISGLAKFSDMWRFVPDTACLHPALFVEPFVASLSDNSICLGDSAFLTVTGGNILSVLPATTAHLTNSTHLTFNPTTSSSYTVVAASSCGVMDTFHYHITVFPPPNITPIDKSICNGSSVFFNGQSISAAGVYRDTLLSVNGCDSFIVLTLSKVPLPTPTNIGAAICSGKSIVFNGNTISTAGSYRDTLTSTLGCDSLLILTVSIVQPTTTPINQFLCNGGSIVFNGQSISAAGVYRDTLIAANGCDSFIVLTLSNAQPPPTNISAVICSGKSIIFNGNTISSAGTYRDTLTTIFGCDSLLILTVTVASPIVTNLSQAICVGDSLLFNGQTITASGLYSATLPDANGCDSNVRLTITIAPKPFAGFLIQPLGDTVSLGKIVVSNISTNSDTAIWILNNELITLAYSNTLPISETGSYCLRLIALSAQGCKDTSQQCFYVIDNAFAIPNAFTPNGDSRNETFYPVFLNKQGIEVTAFRIYNRWGQLIYNNPLQGWDGKCQGEQQPSEVYSFYLSVKQPDSQNPSMYKEVTRVGTFTLLR